ncbi:MAG: hypothetical protein Q8S33_11770 [Myxococcales bacterium]|nr:hypothetical protein [Myxococcales bacterium]MDP3501009.1 hypothetical protein [Myxococcales bacterium]
MRRLLLPLVLSGVIVRRRGRRRAGVAPSGGNELTAAGEVKD